MSTLETVEIQLLIGQQMLHISADWPDRHQDIWRAHLHFQITHFS